jgi:uncharacterized protein
MVLHFENKRRETKMPKLPQPMVENNEIAVQLRSPLSFFLLAFALAVPSLLFGAATGIELLPGLPVAALMAVCPMIAALILVYRQNGKAGAAALLRRSFDFNRIRAAIWLIPVPLLPPFAAALSYGYMRLTGVPVPVPQIAVLTDIGLFLVFFAAALGEELGWSGYVLDPMQARWGALRAALLLGGIWAAWHIVPLIQAHRSLAWIAWWFIGTVATRVIMVWLFNNNDRSVFAMAVFHAMINLCWQMFPVQGSYFDPRVNAVIMAILAMAVTFIWEPKTLKRFKFAASVKR